MREIRVRAWDKQLKKWVDPDIADLWAIYTLHAESVIHEYSQYIGLKDRYGHDIYEGDVIAIKHRDTYAAMRTIHWIDAEAGFNIPGNLCSAGNPWEVIGNIYENDDLLGG